MHSCRTPTGHIWLNAISGRGGISQTKRMWRVPLLPLSCNYLRLTFCAACLIRWGTIFRRPAKQTLLPFSFQLIGRQTVSLRCICSEQRASGVLYKANSSELRWGPIACFRRLRALGIAAMPPFMPVGRKMWKLTNRMTNWQSQHGELGRQSSDRHKRLVHSQRNVAYSESPFICRIWRASRSAPLRSVEIIETTLDQNKPLAFSEKKSQQLATYVIMWLQKNK